MHKISISDVRVLPGDAGFLIDDGKTSILYDCGFAFTGEKLAQNVKNLLGNRNLDFIFLTHSHYDHALGSVYVKEIYPIDAMELNTNIMINLIERELME